MKRQGNRQNQKKWAMIMTAALVMAALAGCGQAQSGQNPAGAAQENESVVQETIVIAAAASLENCLEGQLIPMFETAHPGIQVEGTYDSSGKLQTQIEEGADVDLFFSAAQKQMDALMEENLVDGDSVADVLENRIVLIVPAGTESTVQSFEDLANVEQVAIGDPESVPVGQYARECLTSLGIWDQVYEKASLGTNVTEVLNWVAEGSAPAGIVYATDAAQKADQVTVAAEAPEGTVEKAVYPAGIVSSSAHKESAAVFLEFLQSDEAAAVFEENGFSRSR